MVFIFWQPPTPPLAGWVGGVGGGVERVWVKNNIVNKPWNDLKFINTFRPINPQNTKEIKDIVFLTLSLGWKNEKQPSGPTELDLEAGNLVCPFEQDP